ncbi:MAG TPA: YdeI/OmpD-associated family protein [Terriglobales bacterium]|nr:YdeI/OmpD-associated family protein [Terriglobales bacterium]
MPRTSKAKPSPTPKHFQARLERLRSRLRWVIIRVPFDAARLWETRGQIKVKGEINGFAFRTSLMPTREGWHFLLINKRMQKGARAAEGSVARFQMELDREERTVTIPDQLQRILSQGPLSEARALRRWYDGLNHSTRNDIAKWITEPKGAEARARRAEQIAERLLNVSEAERALPPILQVAFARNPRAREGWDGMSAPRRRGHLFGIFYYRTPDAQARRIEKMLEDATAVAEKMANKRR